MPKLLGNFLSYFTKKLREKCPKTFGFGQPPPLFYPKVQNCWGTKGLLAKLNQIGIAGKLLELFKSYLSNRQQRVVVDGVKSDMAPLSAGIPQGSKLGPILFIIYINDITEDLDSDILIFADDCSLLASADDPAQSTLILNRD